MISFKDWKEEYEFPTYQEPQTPSFKDFVGGWITNSPMNTVYEFIGDLSAHPKAGSRKELLDSHSDIRSMIQQMSTSDWNIIENKISQLSTPEQRRMGHALRWLHMHMKTRATHYDRNANNLSQYAAKFKSRT